MIVAMDGPAGSGKGTVAKEISNRLGFMNIDTGATYRCLALKVLENNIDLNDNNSIIELSKNLNIKFVKDKTYLDNIDVTSNIRTKEVTEIVSPISSIIEVRKNLVELQKSLASSNDVIMEGRDITTVVFPNAEIKIYLDATLEERVERRYKEMMEKGSNITYEEVLENISKRDYNDMHKEVGSLMRTEEQIYIDTTDMSIEEVVNKVEEIIKKYN